MERHLNENTSGMRVPTQQTEPTEKEQMDRQAERMTERAGERKEDSTR